MSLSLSNLPAPVFRRSNMQLFLERPDKCLWILISKNLTDIRNGLLRIHQKPFCFLYPEKPLPVIKDCPVVDLISLEQYDSEKPK